MALPYWEGACEPAAQEVLSKHLGPGMVFYDLGANLGFFTLLAARMVGPKGKVVAFEADPEVARRAIENVEKNGAENVRIIQRAVWSSTGTVPFCRAEISESPERGTGKVVPPTATGSETISVPCIALDDFVRNERPPDMIKCDVEGAEGEAFEGGRQMLYDHRPLVLCELHSERNRTWLTKLFGSLDYSLRWITTRHFLAIRH
jgi:FkbM family methyltransferase